MTEKKKWTIVALLILFIFAVMEVMIVASEGRWPSLQEILTIGLPLGFFSVGYSILDRLIKALDEGQLRLGPIVIKGIAYIFFALAVVSLIFVGYLYFTQAKL